VEQEKPATPGKASQKLALCNSPAHIEKQMLASVTLTSSSFVQSLGYQKISGSQSPMGSEDLLESQDLGDSSLGDHHDGGLKVSGRQVGVDAAVDDELREH
jgi:hypothetical protein